MNECDVRQLFYQTAAFTQQPGYSAGWIAGIVVFAVLSLYMLRRMREQVPSVTISSTS